MGFPELVVIQVFLVGFELRGPSKNLIIYFGISNLGRSHLNPCQGVLLSRVVSHVGHPQEFAPFFYNLGALAHSGLLHIQGAHFFQLGEGVNIHSLTVQILSSLSLLLDRGKEV